MSKILIIDDSADNLITIAAQLRLGMPDAEIITAASGQEGLEASKQKNPHLILLDVHMPVIDGFEVCRQLKRSRATQSIPVILMTAHDSRGSQRALALQSGADAFLTKPVDSDELYAQIKVLLRVRQAEEELLREKEKLEEMVLSRTYALAQLEKRYHSLFDNAADTIFIHDFEGAFLEVNKVACDKLGYGRNELLSMHLRDIVAPESGTLVRDRMDILREKGQVVFESCDIARDGRSIPVEVHARVIDFEGRKAILSICRDITERRALSDELVSAREKAEEASSLKSAILANLSHEFRTPLNGILGIADILHDEVTEPGQKEMVELIMVSGKRLFAALDSCMKLAQLTAGEFRLSLKPLYCSEIAEKAIRQYNQTAREKKLPLRLEVRCDLEIVSDERVLQDILQNLIDNALKFTKEGEIKVILDKINFNGQTRAVLHVQDTGIGIPPERQKLLFQEFRQLSEGMCRAYEGCGLGLSLAKKMTELLGGILTFESEASKGSIFSISLPVRMPAEEEAPLAPPPDMIPRAATEWDYPAASTSKAKHSVLLVEDNYINMLIVLKYLENICTLDHASNGEEALELAQAKHYDAMLIDINLGSDIDGIALQKELRAMKEYEKIPIMAVTGYALSGDRENLLAEGFSHYLPKPFEESELVSIMKEILQFSFA